ncbi:hypothetical protein GCM10027046_28640 [Uliginosibacterium flavum]|uniref:Uncharacterized protein n=1 Tax=Uliginosibacterium flavum TaxID=1396831 RepID=A0ABV2TGS1_9RHOO
MKAFNIDGLSEAELIDLNRRVVTRLRFLQDVRTHSQMLNFSVGDRVGFKTNDGRTIFGILTRYNKKTVTLITEDGHQWNVAPGFLFAAEQKIRDITPQPGTLEP